MLSLPGPSSEKPSNSQLGHAEEKGDHLSTGSHLSLVHLQGVTSQASQLLRGGCGVSHPHGQGSPRQEVYSVDSRLEATGWSLVQVHTEVVASAAAQ